MFLTMCTLCHENVSLNKIPSIYLAQENQEKFMHKFSLFQIMFNSKHQLHFLKRHHRFPHTTGTSYRQLKQVTTYMALCTMTNVCFGFFEPILSHLITLITGCITFQSLCIKTLDMNLKDWVYIQFLLVVMILWKISASV
jgi:hypothetical protein